MLKPSANNIQLDTSSATKVTYAKLQGPVFIPKLGNIKDTLDGSVTPGLTMELTEYGLKCALKGTKFIIPLANVMVMAVA